MINYIAYLQEAEILDIYVSINRKNKPVSTIKTDVIYQQAEIYRQKD